MPFSISKPAFFLSALLMLGVLVTTFAPVSFLPPIPKAQADTTTGLVGHWTFDGTANDASGQGNHGTLVGGPTYTTGILSQALSFDGTDDFVSIPQSASLNQLNTLTWSTWLYADRISGPTKKIIDKHQSTGAGHELSLAGASAGNISFVARRWSTDGQWRTPENVIAAGQWYHLAVTYDYGSTSNDPVIYINGVAQSLTESATPAGALDNEINTLSLGATAAGGNGFPGLLDDVRIYNRALSPEEIKRLYLLGNPTQ